MNKPNITSGPWSVILAGPSVNAEGEPYRIIQTPDAALDVGAPPCMRNEHEANCTAIAAVPDLLAALAAMLKEFGKPENEMHSDIIADSVRLQAIEALTKAGYTF